jgi:hypothetical protein
VVAVDATITRAMRASLANRAGKSVW